MDGQVQLQAFDFKFNPYFTDKLLLSNKIFLFFCWNWGLNSCYYE